MSKLFIRKLTQCRVESEKREGESLRREEESLKREEKSVKREESTRRMFEFSSADSLESSLSLVSGAVSVSSQPTNTLTESQEVTEIIVDPERGTREKRYQDGRLEVWYSNGNRKEVSSDGKTVRASNAGCFTTRPTPPLPLSLALPPVLKLTQVD